MKIGLLSDTHSFLDDRLLKHFTTCDELWHAGDIGEVEVLDRLEAFRPTLAVYGNIDGADIQARAPLNLDFEREGVRVFMTHIGGYPGRYTARVRAELEERRPRLYICGHSHILKVVNDPKRGLLHINPGACGRHGFHQVRTAVRFDLREGRIENLEVIELGKRASLT